MTRRRMRFRMLGIVVIGLWSAGPAVTSAEAQVTRYVSDMSWSSVVNGWGPAERDRSNGELGSSGIAVTQVPGSYERTMAGARQMAERGARVGLKFVLMKANAAEAGATVPEPVAFCASAIASPFFSVDMARRRDGVERIVEIGDGQVSDLVGWSVERFVQIWSEAG